EKSIRLVPKRDLDSAALEQLELAIERAEADAELLEDQFARPWLDGQEHHQTIKPRSASQRDVDGGAPVTSGPFHGDDTSPCRSWPEDQGRPGLKGRCSSQPTAVEPTAALHKKRGSCRLQGLRRS